MTTALLISTYNWPKALSRVLESALLQTRLPDEIIIADDGSGDETKEVIDNFRKKTVIPIKHIWHEDNGFQLAQIRNKAIVECNSDYIIQIDGDIVMTSNFIRDHIIFCKKNHLIIGSRASLTKEYTSNILDINLQAPLNFNTLFHDTKYKLNAIRLPILTSFFSNTYKTKGKHTYYAKGCNMSFWRASAIAINGYNEDMTGWGYEDSELVARLIKFGDKKQFLKFSGIAYHLWHKVSSMTRKNINFGILNETIESENYRTINGLDKYIK